MNLINTSVLKRFPALDDFFSRLGQTSLIKIPPSKSQIHVFAKCEWENPNGTVKDRVVFAMMHQLLSSISQKKQEQLRILEYTGGSLGLSLSKLCAALNIPLTLVLSSSTASSILSLIESDGTEIIQVDKEKGFLAVMQKAIELSKQQPNLEFLYQHENTANLWIHEHTTGEEIYKDLIEKYGFDNPTTTIHWVASIGTGGTLIGCYKALKKFFKNVYVYAVTPKESPYATKMPPNGLPKFSGSGGLGFGIRQSFVQPYEAIGMTHFEFSYEKTLKAIAEFYKKTKIKIGSSAAANWLASCEVAKKLKQNGNGNTDHVIVAAFPSGPLGNEWNTAENYL